MTAGKIENKMKKFIFLFFLCSSLMAKDYFGAELRTKASYTYGRFEVRMKAAVGHGLLSSFFTYHDTAPYQTWNEIDIEIMGRYQNDIQYNTITPGQINHVYADYLTFNPQQDFHVYGFEWTPDYVAWFVDGEERMRQTDSHIATLKWEQKIMMNIWQVAWDGWAGPFTPKVLPAFAYYDYVSYASYTPGEGSVGSLKAFTPQWRDDFNFWDTSRWDKATHTFDGNNSVFNPANAVFRDGCLILCLTEKTHPGYQDKTPPNVLWARAETANTIAIGFSEAVDQSSAELPTNYELTDLKVLGVRSVNPRTVVLTTTPLDAKKTYRLRCRNLADLWSPANKMIQDDIEVILSRPLSLPICINVGGNASGGYLADQAWSEKTEYGYEDGRVFTLAAEQEISGTEDDEIYRRGRIDIKHYRVRLANGTYRLTIMLAESYWKEPDQRLIDIRVQGEKVVQRLDVYAQTGAYRAYEVRLDQVQVQQGVLDIHLTAQKDYSLLNGLRIETGTTGTGTSSSLPEAIHSHRY